MRPDEPVRQPDISEQGRALGDPTRYAIFEHLRAAPGPQSVARLTEVFGLHPNAIRLHLGKLRDAGLIVEESARSHGRGRPALLYRLSPGAIERWESTGPHEELSMMLLDMVQTGRSAREVGRASGARIAGSLSGRDDDSVATVVGVARRLGFEPTQPRPVADRAGSAAVGGSGQEVVLQRCPFAVGAQRAPQVVCELHRGLAEGVLAATGSPARVDLVIRDPRTAGCRLLVTTVTPR